MGIKVCATCGNHDCLTAERLELATEKERLEKLYHAGTDGYTAAWIERIDARIDEIWDYLDGGICGN